MIDLSAGLDRVVYEAGRLLEAPNWLPDGSGLHVNGQGRIYALSLEDALPLRPIGIRGVSSANNDHIISSDGTTLFFSSDGAVFAVPVQGGRPRRLTPRGSARYYLHGLSPDGRLAACTVINPDDRENGRAIRLVRTASGGAGKILLAGPVPVDGPEWTPDGRWIWFNGEIGAARAGHSRLFRVRPDGSELQQMTDSACVDWFPHISPSGLRVAFLRYPPATNGHPPDRPVQICLMDVDGGQPRTIARFTGGQGSMNVNSWSPDSRRIAYVAYPGGTPSHPAPDPEPARGGRAG